MARSIRPRSLAVAFGVYFLLIALASWGFSQSLGQIWYHADLTRWVYSTYMVIAAVFLIGLGGLGLSIRRSFGRQIRELERQGGTSRDEAPDALPPPLPETPQVQDRVDRDIDELLESLTEIETTTAREAAVMESGDTYSAAHGASSAPPGAQRAKLAQRQKFLSAFVAGPGLVVAIILGISGMMLPGADDFAQTYYRLNTALILGIGYSWLGVGAYVAVAVAALVSGADERRKK